MRLPSHTIHLPSRTLLALFFAGAAMLLLPSCGKKESSGSSETAKKQNGFPGYTLVHQLANRSTDLIDMEGRTVHRWTSQNGTLAGGSYLLEDGRLVRSSVPLTGSRRAPTPGLSGMIEMLDWEGNLLWSFTRNEEDNCLHHDIEVLPNGNILMLVMEEVGTEEQIALGRDPKRATRRLHLDYLIEMKPGGTTGGEIVWEWHLKDHLIQDFDKTKKNYGVVSDNPGRVDPNFIESLVAKKSATSLRQMQSLGYVGSSANVSATTRVPDQTHSNSVAYSPSLDQILLSVRSLGEIWIIDHSTTTPEAASSKGGKQGRGGDLLYRWGNPQSYQSGAPADQQLFGQHDAQWIKPGYPGEGNIILFNNGECRPDGEYSTIEEIKPPLKEDGSYERAEGEAFGPEKPAWRYMAEKKEDFSSSFISGVQRLQNGNTLICSGVQGWVFEVTPDGEITWEHKMDTNSQSGGGRVRPGMGKAGGPGAGGLPGKGPGMRGRPGMAGGKGMRPGMKGKGRPGMQQSGAASGTDTAAAPPGPPPGLGDAPGMMGPPGMPAEGDSRYTLAEMAVLLGMDSPFSIPPPMPMMPPMPPGDGDPGMMPPGGPPGAGGPGGGGPPAGVRGGLFRAVRYGVDYPAFKDKDLKPITQAAVR